MEFNDRLREIRKKSTQTQEEFAFEIGINRGAYKNYENGTSQPPYDVLKSISNRFEVDLNWLILGQKSNLKSNPLSNLLPENAPNGGMSLGRGVVVRHLSSLRAVAGDVISIDSAFEEVEEWIVPRLGIVGGSGLAMYSFEVQGDSMLPTIAPRDLLLCEAPITTLQNIQNNAIYVIVNADGVRCKRLRYLPQSHSVCIFSDNKAYRDEELKEGTFSALRVVQRITNVSQFF
jgi:transcriptional regulator with XRE-family HTH domain